MFQFFWTIWRFLIRHLTVLKIFLQLIICFTFGWSSWRPSASHGSQTCRGLLVCLRYHSGLNILCYNPKLIQGSLVYHKNSTPVSPLLARSFPFELSSFKLISQLSNTISWHVSTSNRWSRTFEMSEDALCGNWKGFWPRSSIWNWIHSDTEHYFCVSYTAYSWLFRLIFDA